MRSPVAISSSKHAITMSRWQRVSAELSRHTRGFCQGFARNLPIFTFVFIKLLLFALFFVTLCLLTLGAGEVTLRTNPLALQSR